MGRKRKVSNAAASPSIRQKAYQFIQRKIVTGELTAGKMISELDIAREPGSSRTLVREAMSQLVAEGIRPAQARGVHPREHPGFHGGDLSGIETINRVSI